jgi:NAD-dependent dihydropyrimidine dehydrogenase PreA subunit
MFNSYQTTTLQYDPSACTGCKMCAIVCPHAVFVMDGRQAVLTRPEACMECGACQLNCPANAISVESGVGCASAMIRAALTRKEEATCGCG